jgi:hypothetical protein
MTTSKQFITSYAQSRFSSATTETSDTVFYAPTTIIQSSKLQKQ